MRNSEIKEVQEVKDGSREVAAFFDLDGTLVAGPSLEQELFLELRWRGLIPAKNYFIWLAEAVRLAQRGIQDILHGNKMYLKDVATDLAEAAAAKRAPRFYREGMERVEWHARQGHAIYLVSGTLERLASSAALAIVARLAVRGIATKIGFCATRLQEDCGRWTGRIEGAAMFGEVKPGAMRKIAKQEGFLLEKSYAYGNAMSDRWMLAAVGRATAVNPSAELEKLAGMYGWPVMRWQKEEKNKESTTQRHGVRREEKKRANEKAEPNEIRVLGDGRTEQLRIGSPR